MKRSFTLFAGIVFLVAVSVAACNQNGKKPKDVKIKLISVSEINRVKHLKLDDSIHIGIDSTFITNVYPGQKVIWKIGPGSNISEITDVKGRNKHFIFIKDPEINPVTKEFEMVIPLDAAKCVMEEYIIKYKLEKDDSTIYISDPYLRIPDD